MSWSDFPAFEWVHSLNPANTDYSDAGATNVWYLPAINELGDNNANSLYVAYNADRTAFNGKLTAAGSTGFGNLEHWSSSEDGNDGAWFVDFNDGSTYYNFKVNDYSARCVLAF